MAVVKDNQAPYAPVDAVMGVIDGYRNKHPHTPFTTENIQMLGVSDSIAPRTIQALRLLDLIDDDGEPTPAMVALREASKQEFPSRLADVITAAYSEVFQYRDPAKDPPESLREVFRFYRPPSMQPRMLRLFYGLCVAASLIDEAPVVENAPDAGGATANRRNKSSEGGRVLRRQRKAQSNGGASAGKTSDPKPPPPIPTTKRPDIIEALVAKLPKQGEPWTTEGFEWWMDMMRLAAPSEYGFEPKVRDG